MTEAPPGAGRDLRQAIFNRRTLICIFTGFSSGLPFFVYLQLLPAWLHDQGISMTEIGLFALLGVPYNWKFLWAPFMDRYAPPFLGRRRGWMILTQLALLVLLGVLGSLNPQQSMWMVATLALSITFFSASQDVVLDAYRRELLPDEELGLGNSVHVQAYRIAGLIPGSLSLILADHLAWSSVFWITALFMLPGMIMCLLISEPRTEPPRQAGLREAVIAPFREYLQRAGLGRVVLVLAFLFLYKLGDTMATSLATVFYLDLGFTKTQVGLVAKNAALWPAIVGGLLGGVVMIRLGINRALWLFGVVQLVSILGFVVLAEAGAVTWLLALVIAFEYLGVGLGTAAFIAFIARETSRQFAATQFALFTALATLPRTFASAGTGLIVDTMGWTSLYIICVFLALPGMALLWWVAPWRRETESQASGIPAK